MKLPACCPCPAKPRARAPGSPVPATLPVASCRVMRRHAGVALITVLLIVFLASVTATGLAALQQRAIRRSTVLLHQQQARLYTLGAEQWALVILTRDRQQNETDHLGEAWATPPAALPVESGALTSQIRDLQGCFNLNNLWQPDPSQSAAAPDETQKAAQTEDEKADEAAETEAENSEDNADTSASSTSSSPQSTAGSSTASKSQSGHAELNKAQFAVLQQLLERLELKPELAQAIVDWIDPDSDPRFPDGAEDSDYTVQNPAYLAANQPLTSVSELRLIKGIDADVYAKLAPLVCALPSGTPLNVNTAPALVLAALNKDLDLADVTKLVEDRPASGYANVNEFLEAAKLTVNAQVQAQLSADSQYFLLRTEARVGDGRAILYSTLYRRDENSVRILRRSFGNQD